MMLRRVAWVVLAFIMIACVCLCEVPPNPLWRSQRDLRVWVLKQAPLGSTIDQVKTLIRKRRWTVVGEWQGRPSNVSSAVPYPKVKDYPAVKGEHFIHADLGSYQGIPFRVGVDAHWGFDSAGRLVDLRIRKVPEAL